MNDSKKQYTVTVKKAHGYTRFETARLHISVGQQYHEAEKFAATMLWASTRFKKIVVCVNDTLQRYNYRIEKGLPEAQALLITQKQGDAWIERNSAALGIPANVQICRWEEWRNMPDYPAHYAEVKRIYAEHPDIRAAMDAIVKETWDRRTKHLQFIQDSMFTGFHASSTQYLLEETAAMIIMFLHEDAADIYPGTIALPFDLFHRYYNMALPESIAQKAITRIDFRHRQSDETKVA